MNKENNCGYIKIDKNILKDQCKECKKYILITRDSKEIKRVEEFRTKWNNRARSRNNSFIIGKLFPIKELHDLSETKKLMDELYAKSEKENFYCGDEKYNYHSQYACYTLDKVEKIMECCDSAVIETEITLSVEMYHQIIF